MAAGNLTLIRDAGNGLITDTALLMSGNTVSTNRGYNGFGEIESVDVNVNTTDLYDSGFIRDKLGRITQETETISGVTTTYDYVYDIAGRLVEVKTDSVTTNTYQYDSNSNRTHVNGVLLGAYDDQDRLTQYDNNQYTYTDNGELLSKTDTLTSETTAYSYDVLGNLMSVILPDSTQIDYVIDGQNRRTGKKVDGVLTQGFLYKDQLIPLQSWMAATTSFHALSMAQKPMCRITWRRGEQPTESSQTT